MVLIPGNPVVGGTVLRRAAIESPGYSPGPPVIGWTINQDGSFSFGSGGSVTGPLKIFNSHGAVIYEVEPSKDAWFLYADTGSATQGRLLVSGASADGTDDFGNTFFSGLTVFGANGIPVGMSLPTTSPDEGASAYVASGVVNPALAGEYQYLILASPEMTGASENDRSEITLAGSVKGNASSAQGALVYVSTAPSPVNCLTWDTNGVEIPVTLKLPDGNKWTSTGISEDSWHYVGQTGQPAFGTGWSNRGSGWVNMAYRKVLSPPNSIEIRGWVAVAATGDLVVFTLPSGYQPVNTQTIVGYGDGQAIQFNISANGAVQAAGTLPATGDYYLAGLISLDQ